MKNIFLFIVLFINLNLIAKDNIPEWENPEIFAINKEETRATSFPYPTQSMALKDDFAESPYYRSLNGRWKFFWASKIAQLPNGFYKENYDVSNWVEMPVPGNWEFNGYGIPIYKNIGFGFHGNAPRINREDSPSGAYRHEFEIPEKWNGRKVFIHFEGGTNSMYLWLNGEKVGYTENSKSPAEFDITPYIRKGKNTLACEVHKFSDGSYLEDQDMWRLGGINRSVYLYSTAQTRIKDFFVHPGLDQNYRNGLLNLEVVLQNYTNSVQNQKLEVAVLDRNDKVVFKKESNVEISSNNTLQTIFSGDIKSPLKWTAETPNLYTLLILLKDEKGAVIEATSHKIGFRNIEIKDGQLFVNGKKIYVKGVNLHEFNAFTGQVVGREEMERNIQLMKELNINAVRTSHYPQAPLWYKLCDEYGLYLVDEANQESHGLGYTESNASNFPEWHGAHMDRVIRLVERDKNHPSVIIWSLGNESSNGKAFFDTYDWIKARDNSRPVQYEQAYRVGRNTDIICPMYPGVDELRRNVEEDLGRPYIMCEYAHAMGNSMGNMEEYWDAIRASKNMQGGFIWEWYNHGYPTKDEQGRFYWAYGGDRGGYNIMNDENFCMDGIISPDQKYIPHTHIVKKIYQNILFEAKDLNKGIITVINDFRFTDLSKNNYTYKWQLLKNGEIVNEGNFDVDILADSRKDIQLNIPKIKNESGVEYYLQVFAYTKQQTELLPAGFESAKEEFAFDLNDYFVVDKQESASQNIEKTDEKIRITANNVEYEFSIKNNEYSLMNIAKDGARIFNELPKLNFWRAPTDNDLGEKAHVRLHVWNAAGENVIYRYKSSEQTERGYVLNYEAKLRGIEAKVDLVYTINSDGSLTTEAGYKSLTDDMLELMRFGMIMILPKHYSNFAWYGRGPHENYVDRHSDTFMGIWNGKVEEQAFAYYRPQETGNKTDVRWLKLTDGNGKGVSIKGLQALSVSATNNRPEDLDAGLTRKQQHASDILPRNETVLCVDLFQRGLGSVTSWGGQPLNEYRFWAKEYKYGYTISFID